MAGFCSIIREERNVKVKDAMLEYLTEMMDDAQDFGWASAKGAHALILCRMEEGKVNWLNSDKLDRLRRAHAQKVVNGIPLSGQKNKSKGELLGVPCKYFQSRKCSHKVVRTSNGQLSHHMCSHCHSAGKRFLHSLKECRNKRHQEPKNEKPKNQVLFLLLVRLILILPHKKVNTEAG